jgi:hypothetical protein
MSENEPKKKTFGELIAEIMAGIDEDVLTMLAETYDVARSKGTTGSASALLTVKLAVQFDANGEMTLKCDHTTLAPKMPKAATRRWLEPKTLQIVAANPKQMQLPVRDLPAKPTNIRSMP